MIEKDKIKIGDRIIQNDPEEQTDTPYKGTVTDICETGSGPYDYYAVIDLDEESMQIPYVGMMCPEGEMHCFPWTIDLLTEEAPVIQPFHAALVKKEPYRGSYGFYQQGTYKPYYFIGPDGKEHFIRNLVTNTQDSYKTDASQRREMAEFLRNLRANHYRFMCFYGRDKDPLRFLKWVRENGYRLEVQGELFRFHTRDSDAYDRDSVDFSGNVCEYSAAFSYRIYDREFFAELLRELRTVKRHIAWRREKRK